MYRSWTLKQHLCYRNKKYVYTLLSVTMWTTSVIFQWSSFEVPSYCNCTEIRTCKPCKQTYKFINLSLLLGPNSPCWKTIFFWWFHQRFLQIFQHPLCTWNRTWPSSKSTEETWPRIKRDDLQWQILAKHIGPDSAIFGKPTEACW